MRAIAGKGLTVFSDSTPITAPVVVRSDAVPIFYLWHGAAIATLHGSGADPELQPCLTYGKGKPVVTELIGREVWRHGIEADEE